MVPLERNLYGRPLAGLRWDRQSEEALLELEDGRKIPDWECVFVHRKQGLFLSVHVDDIKNGSKEAEYGSQMEDIDEKMWISTNPHHFIDHVYLGCTHRECKPNETVIGQYTKMFESRISTRSNRKITGWQKPDAQTVAWSYDMEGHAQKYVEAILRIGKQESGATAHSFKPLPG